VAVLGGNLPPSRTPGTYAPFSELAARTTVRLPARRNRPMARSIFNSTTLFWFKISQYTRDHLILSSRARNRFAVIELGFCSHFG